MENSANNSENDANEEGFVEETRSEQPIGALVPELVGVGVLATTVIVAHNVNETVLDFVVRIARPFQIVARVAIPNTVYPRIVAALLENIEMYEKQFGGHLPITTLPSTEPRLETNGDEPVSIQEIYDDLKLPTALHSGVYANAVTIGHTRAEFWIDFITTFYPRASVSCRIYIAAGNINRVAKTLARHSN